jgi:hypothetical protein
MSRGYHFACLVPCALPCRYGPSSPLIFYPLRELGRRELAVLCQHRQLPTVDNLAGAGGAAAKPHANGGRGTGGCGASINSLAAGFVEALQANNPGSVSNIVGTIAKLQVGCDGGAGLGLWGCQRSR